VRLVFTENMHHLVLPPAHKFPLGKYVELHARLDAAHPGLLTLGAPASWQDITLVHTPDYVARVRDGKLADADVRRLGFPWSEALVTRARRSVGGTLAALAWAMDEGAAGHIAGGTHHAFRDRGEGFCVFNDIAVAVEVARRDHGVRRAAIVDLDVHQGNGTAAIFAGDPEVFTCSLHGARNYPFRKETSSLDVPLADGAGDDAYLDALDRALDPVRAHRPELLFFQAGVDALAGDRLGRLALSHAGLRARDARVFALARELAVPLVVTLGGGYHPDIHQSVEAHANVFSALVARFP
jgi:acetoin utilization deacetylase AcuC-like enzyme